MARCAFYDATPAALKNRKIFSTVSDHDLILTSFNLEEIISNTTDNVEQTDRLTTFFPNPVAYGGQITLALPATKEKKTVEVYDLSGRLQLSQQISQPISNFSLEGLDTGLYLLVFRIGSNVESHKLFIQ